MQSTGALPSGQDTQPARSLVALALYFIKESTKAVQKQGFQGRRWGYVNRKAVKAITLDESDLPDVQHWPIWAGYLDPVTRTQETHPIGSGPRLIGEPDFPSLVRSLAGLVPRYWVGNPLREPVPLLGFVDGDRRRPGFIFPGASAVRGRAWAVAGRAGGLADAAVPSHGTRPVGRGLDGPGLGTHRRPRGGRLGGAVDGGPACVISWTGPVSGKSPGMRPGWCLCPIPASWSDSTVDPHGVRACGLGCACPACQARRLILWSLGPCCPPPASPGHLPAFPGSLMIAAHYNPAPSAAWQAWVFVAVQYFAGGKVETLGRFA